MPGVGSQTTRGFCNVSRDIYRLEFGDVLPPDNWPCNLPHLTQEQSQILDQEIQNLLQKNAIESTSNMKGFFSSMFNVPQKDGGWRPIINLKCLNAYLAVSHLEGISSLKDVLQEGDFMGKIDLEDAYLSVPVHQEHRDFLKFCWRQRFTGSDPFHSAWLLNQEFLQRFCGPLQR